MLDKGHSRNNHFVGEEQEQQGSIFLRLHTALEELPIGR
jgi:hypothetical protein